MNTPLKAVIAVTVGVAVVHGGGYIYETQFMELGCQPLSHIPDGEFTYTWNSHNDTMMVQYVSGDSFGNGYRDELYVRVRDDETDRVANITWEKEIEDRFIPGDETLRITQESVDLELSANDTAQVIWRGTLPDHPQHCHDAGTASRQFQMNKTE